MSQHELHCLKKFLIDAERGIVFSAEDAKKTEKFLVQMINNKGIDKMIDFFNIIKILCSSGKRGYLCSENYKLAFDERGNKRMTDVYTYIRENYFKPISLEKISKIARMSSLFFQQIF